MIPGHSRLLLASGNSVRLWDLDALSSPIGELTKATMSPSSDVLSVAAVPGGGDADWVVTGSRDRYIKLYRVKKGRPPGVVEPWLTLEPPHYENVTCLLPLARPDAAAGLPSFSLFSGSRDKNLMLWEAGPGGVVRRGMEAPAHKDALLGLAALPPPFNRIVASAGKDGWVKLWSGEEGELARVDAVHAAAAPINALIANATFLFTASE